MPKRGRSRHSSASESSTSSRRSPSSSSSSTSSVRGGRNKDRKRRKDNTSEQNGGGHRRVARVASELAPTKGSEADADDTGRVEEVMHEIESLKDIIRDLKKKRAETLAAEGRQKIDQRIEVLKEMITSREKELIGEMELEFSNEGKQTSKESEFGHPEETKDPPVDKSEDGVALFQEMHKEVASLKCMLKERRQLLAQEGDAAARLAVGKEVDVLKDMLRERKTAVVIRQDESREMARETGKAKERSAVQDVRPSLPDGVGVQSEKEQVEHAYLVPPLGKKVPPCDLPVWCAVPNVDDIKVDVVLVRHTVATSKTKRVDFGRRSWVLLGRRYSGVGGAEVDIGLASQRASRNHALLLRNWLGQVFLMDLRSSHGTFLDKKRLPPHVPFQWKVGAVVFFADDGVERFEMQAKALDSSNAAAPDADEGKATRASAWLTEAVGAAAAKAKDLTAASAAARSAAAPQNARTSQRSSTHGKKATDSAELYPDTWDVPADGLSSFYSWRP